MSSTFVGLLILLSTGAFVTLFAVDKWAHSDVAPDINTHADLCRHIVEGLLNTTDARLWNYHWNAFHKLCKPDVRAYAEEVGKCAREVTTGKFALRKCPFSLSVETDCGTTVKALNCLLDLVGAECGGDEAVIISAFGMEYGLAISPDIKSDDCGLIALQERQKYPKSASTTLPPTTSMIPTQHTSGICRNLDWFASLTSDPAYYKRSALEIYCNEEQVQRIVSMKECGIRTLRLPEVNAACREYKLGLEDFCEAQPKYIKCLAEIIGQKCGGPQAVEIFAFGFELWLQALFTLLPKGSLCEDEFLATLRDLQVPRND